MFGLRVLGFRIRSLDVLQSSFEEPSVIVVMVRMWVIVLVVSVRVWVGLGLELGEGTGKKGISKTANVNKTTKF